MGLIWIWQVFAHSWMTVRGGHRGLEVTVMSKLALDPKPAPSVLPVRHTHPFTPYLGGLGLQCEGDVFLQGAELLVCLGLEGVGKHTAVRAGVQRRRREFVGVEGAQGRRRQGGLAGCGGCWCVKMWRWWWWWGGLWVIFLWFWITRSWTSLQQEVAGPFVTWSLITQLLHRTGGAAKRVNSLFKLARYYLKSPDCLWLVMHVCVIEYLPNSTVVYILRISIAVRVRRHSVADQRVHPSAEAKLAS